VKPQFGNIKELNLFNVYVFSLPRSGSSMMTGILEKLGVKMVYTSEEPEKRKKMDEQYKKRLGEYNPNEHFYEITENPFENWMKIINTPYSGCKVIIPVRGMIWGAITYKPSKIIMMWRDIEEIRQSQQAFYRGNAEEEAEVRRAYLRTALVATKLQLENAKKNKKIIDFMIIEYRDVLDNPKNTIKNIAKFINSQNEIDEAIASVKPKTNRFKKEELEIGI